MGWQEAPVLEESASESPAWMRAPEVEDSKASPSSLAVAGNAAMKGLAGIPDMFLNAPANAANVGKYLYGDAMERMGHPQWESMNVTPQPNLVHQALTRFGLIKPENEPQDPGQRILDAAVQGGVGMAASPASSLAGLAKNATVGALSGGASGLTKEATGSDTAALAAGMATPFAAQAMVPHGTPAINPVQAQTLKEGQAAGYVVPPSRVTPSFLNNRLESLAGKAAVGQEAAARNQGVTNALAAKSLGLPKETALTPDVIRKVREDAGMAYNDVAATSGKAESALEELKKARYESTVQFNYYNKSGNPEALVKAKEAKAWAGLLEEEMAGEAKKAGKPELIKALAEARVKIAKSYDVERALNKGAGNVSATVLGQILSKKGDKAMTGELATAGKMAQAFPQSMREASKVPSAGVSGTDAAAGALLGTLGYGAGGPGGLLAAGLPLLRGPARALVLSDPYQARMTRPGAQPPPLSDTALKSLLLGRAMAERN